MTDDGRMWEFDTCLHEGGHAVVALACGRGVSGVAVYARTAADAERATGGRMHFDGLDQDILEPDHLRNYLTILAAGTVAPLLHDRWTSFGCRWLTEQEVSQLPLNSPAVADFLIYPSPFSSLFTDERYGHLVDQEWPADTDTALIANGAFFLSHGFLVERALPLPPIWEATQRMPEFLNEIRNAERLAADTLRRNWEALLRLSDALCRSANGYLPADKVSELCGQLTP